MIYLFDRNERKQDEEVTTGHKTKDKQEAYGWNSWTIPYQQMDGLIPKVPFPYPLKVFS